MKYDYDILVIGLGPAGMAVSVMSSEMGLKVCAVEKHKIGGECMNVGCIPSKSLLRIAKARHTVAKLPDFGLAKSVLPAIKEPFKKVNAHIDYINKNKTLGMFKKVDLILGKGEASFVDKHIVEVGKKKISAKRIFICTGTKPFTPPIPGIEHIDILNNESIFNVKNVPKSLTIVGGGAIGCEMAQAFARLGSKVSIVHMDKHLIPFGDPESGELLEEVFTKEGINVYNARKLVNVKKTKAGIELETDKGEKLVSEKIMIAAGRKPVHDSLKLEKAGVKYDKRGITVNKHLQTSQRHIYAPGDCHGKLLLSHAAMHQGMLALMNSMMPRLFRFNFKKYVVPWTVFTEPQVSHVGLLESQVKARKKKYSVVGANYGDYGAAIAEKVGIGFVKAFISPAGKIYGARIVGEGSGEMINEWALAIQKKIRIFDIMFLQHSFPTMGFLTKRVSENWMMGKMESSFLRKMIRGYFRLLR